MTFGVLVRQPVPKSHLSSKIFLPVQMGTVSWLEMVKINTNRLGARVCGMPHYIYLELPKKEGFILNNSPHRVP